jgi:hypothetical protein
VLRPVAASFPRYAVAAAGTQIGPAASAVPAVEQFQRRMATQGACVRCLSAFGPVSSAVATGGRVRGGATRASRGEDLVRSRV